MALIFFVYGLSFFCLGLAILLYPAAGINFRLGKGIKLIGAFGVLHGVNEWIGMFLLGRPPQDFFIVRI
ncbi:MAG: hypothetical protein ABIA77_03055, partial [Candidatus Omnitrophota bacterium]